MQCSPLYNCTIQSLLVFHPKTKHGRHVSTNRAASKGSAAPAPVSDFTSDPPADATALNGQTPPKGMTK